MRSSVNQDDSRFAKANLARENAVLKPIRDKVLWGEPI